MATSSFHHVHWNQNHAPQPSQQRREPRVGLILMHLGFQRRQSFLLPEDGHRCLLPLRCFGEPHGGQQADRALGL